MNYFESHEWVSASLLKVIDRSPSKAKAYINNTTSTTEAMTVGSVFHELMETETTTTPVFDQSKRPEKDKTFGSKINKKWKESFGVCITADQYVDLKSMVAAVKASRFYKGLESVKLETREKVYCQEINGQKAKCKPDALYHGKDDSIVCVDWKTTSESLSASPYNAARVVKKFGYQFQAVHYTEILKQDFHKPVHFFFVFVDKTAPFDVLPVYISPKGEMYNETFGRWFELLKLTNDCFRTGNWPTLEESITDKYIQL